MGINLSEEALEARRVLFLVFSLEAACATSNIVVVLGVLF